MRMRGTPATRTLAGMKEIESLSEIKCAEATSRPSIDDRRQIRIRRMQRSLKKVRNPRRRAYSEGVRFSPAINKDRESLQVPWSVCMWLVQAVGRVIKAVIQSRT